MKIIQIISFTALALLAVSCGNSQKQDGQADERFVDKVDQKTGISSISPYKDSDTITVDGKLYKYSYDFHKVDSLPRVKYQSGIEYYDNGVKLVIKHEGEVVLEKNFTKSTFKSYIPDKLWPTSGLIGFTYNVDRRIHNEHNAFYFIATIGNLDDPDEIAYPLEIKIDTAGGMTITKYEELETEPLRKGLNVDPDEDGV